PPWTRHTSHTHTDTLRSSSSQGEPFFQRAVHRRPGGEIEQESRFAARGPMSPCARQRNHGIVWRIAAHKERNPAAFGTWT
ncbi:unnamed protein product, partial [Boreogadus saida]